MKRTTIIFGAMLLLAAGATAQDTLHLRNPKGIYYQSHPWFQGRDTLIWNGGNSGGHDFAQAVYSADTITVYGIAAMLGTPLLMEDSAYLAQHSPYILDTALTSVREELRLYYVSGDSLRAHPEGLPVNMAYTPVSYYLHMDSVLMMQYWVSDLDTSRIFRVYERYFKAPVTVVDTFYLGITGEGGRLVDGWAMTYNRWGMGIVNFVDWRMTFGETGRKYATHFDSGWEFSPQGEIAVTENFIFPILVPGENLPDDTTQVGPVDTTAVDTVGIASAQLLQRYVNVLPNPASGRVQVASSFGLRSVEVYNAAGVRVLEQKATGYVATLDVSALPEGAYLVRIATPSGTATKKLLVRRQ